MNKLPQVTIFIIIQKYANFEHEYKLFIVTTMIFSSSLTLWTICVHAQAGHKLSYRRMRPQVIVLFHSKCIKKYDSRPQVVIFFVIPRYDRKIQRCDTKVRRQLAASFNLGTITFATTTFATLLKNYNFRHVRVNIHIYCKSGNSIVQWNFTFCDRIIELPDLQ